MSLRRWSLATSADDESNGSYPLSATKPFFVFSWEKWGMTSYKRVLLDGIIKFLELQKE
jgi:hypothetical protein